MHILLICTQDQEYIIKKLTYVAKMYVNMISKSLVPTSADFTGLIATRIYLTQTIDMCFFEIVSRKSVDIFMPKVFYHNSELFLKSSKLFRMCQN